MKNIKFTLLVFVAIALAGLAAFYVVSDLREVNSGNVVTGVVGETEGEFPYEVDMVPIEGVEIPIPDLSREVNFINATAKTKESIQNISAVLKVSPGKFALWMDLSSLRKSIEDYEGSELILEYLTKVATDNGIVYRNLADLYAYYLKDTVKAEQNILIAIEKDPQQIEYYFKAVEIFRDIMKNMTKARAIVEKGLEANPNSGDLESLAASLK